MEPTSRVGQGRKPRPSREHAFAQPVGIRVAEVAEMVDFILADAKQELCLARRRGASE